MEHILIVSAIPVEVNCERENERYSNAKTIYTKKSTVEQKINLNQQRQTRKQRGGGRLSHTRH